MTPADLQGLWRRRWLRALGVHDDTTRVYWAQGGDLFADIRVPAEGTASDAEGFAGHITLEGDVCTWHREIDRHGPSDRVDAGRLRHDAAGDLIEEGVHADYTELWSRADISAAAQRVALRGTQGMLVTGAEWFLLALGGVGGTYAFGRWSGDDGVAEVCTDRALEGTAVLRRDGRAFAWLGDGGAREPLAPG